MQIDQDRGESMRDPALALQHVSKSYRIARNRGGTNRATDAVIGRLRHPLRRTEYEDFDALNDVSFAIEPGQAVGIVGRNGAGKSTLLKLITRITAPSTGQIDLRGRVGSLLEVGTGFHPELTGRENIFLNGALLGMKRSEIRRRFDEIVEFSGAQQFLDTPVKRYSSGMYVRLAFSVAAHLETEILAIDEVLAVGDAEFQAKSLALMRDVAQQGRTVLYVSHQAQTVTTLCTAALYLDCGRLAFYGSVEGALSQYRDSFEAFRERQLDPATRAGTGELRFESATMGDTTIEPADDKVVEFTIGANPGLHGQYFVSCHLNDANGVMIAQCDSRLVGAWFDPGAPARGALSIKDLWLKPGRYSVDLFLCKFGVLDAWEGAAAFQVLPTLPYPQIADGEAARKGIVLADFSYERW